MRSFHDASSEHILILAPHGRDARLAQALLADADLTAVIVRDLPELVDALGETAGAVLITEEAVRTADLTGSTVGLPGSRHGQTCRSSC